MCCFCRKGSLHGAPDKTMGGSLEKDDLAFQGNQVHCPPYIWTRICQTWGTPNCPPTEMHVVLHLDWCGRPPKHCRASFQVSQAKYRQLMLRKKQFQPDPVNLRPSLAGPPAPFAGYLSDVDVEPGSRKPTVLLGVAAPGARPSLLPPGCFIYVLQFQVRGESLRC